MVVWVAVLLVLVVGLAVPAGARIWSVSSMSVDGREKRPIRWQVAE